MSRALKDQYLKCHQAICVSMVIDPTPMTLARVTVFEESFRTDCASAQIASVFDTKKSIRALKPDSDLDQVLATNLKILEMGKLLESHSKINMLKQARGRGGALTTRGGGGRGAGARGGALTTRTDPEQSCLWCAKKGHTIFDCPTPPTPALKKVRDDIIAKRAAKGRNETRKARRLAAAATSAIVSEDESDEGDDIALAEGTFAALQSFFEANEPAKRSSQESLAPSLASSSFSDSRPQVERRVSIDAEPKICPVPSRCLLPAFVVIAKALRFQTSYNKRYKSSLLDAMELEFGFCRRSGNTPENQLARLLKLEANCTYED
jgi:hypothetical protein